MGGTLVLSFLLLCGCVDSAYVKKIRNHRRTVYAEFFNPDTSPLKEKDRKNFSGLNYYEITDKLFIAAHFKRTPGEKPFEMVTSGEKRPVYVKYGEINFELEGKKLTLHSFQNQKNSDYLFVPFTDLTTGDETYGGGRFLELAIPEDDKIELDFNLAFNPYCVYNDGYSCPIPPPENFLDVKILAGEKKFSDDEH
ncbi:MAG: hypothetical protein COA57_10505 [Flavobacteriales bacterium]|nr:MAG: hypothetical protein COA57_10505 [Flavobacteriales bacterium]